MLGRNFKLKLLDKKIENTTNISNIVVTAPQKQRYDNLDLMKCIAIILVVFVHFNSLSADIVKNISLTTYLNYFINAICSIAVPTFFIVNGALLLNKNYELHKHVKKTISIIVMTYIWAIITSISVMLINKVHISRHNIIINILSFQPGYTAYLWFLQALFVLYIFFPLIKNCYDNRKKCFDYFLIIVIIFSFIVPFIYVIDYFIQLFFQKPYLSELLSSVVHFSPVNGIYGYSIGYFMVGGILFSFREKLDTVKYKLISLIAFLVSLVLWFGYGVVRSLHDGNVFAITNTGYDSILILITAISFFILCLDYKNKGILGKLINLIGKNTLGIYLLHIIMGNILSKIQNSALFSGNLILNLLLTLINVNLCLGVCLLFKRIPFVKKLFTL